MMSPRQCALEIFYETVQNKGYLNLLYKQNAKDFSERDRKFITLILSSGLANYYTCEYILSKFISGKKVKPIIKCILVMAIDQLLILKMPEHAVIFESVELCSAVHKPMLKGFVNGVLRSILRNPNIEYPNKDTLKYYAVKNSKPLWLMELWETDYGFENAVKYSRIRNAGTAVRFKGGFDAKDFLDRNGYKGESVDLIENAFILENSYGILDTDEFKSGLISFQGVGSMVSCKALAPKPGDRVLDACSAPGGKTAFICELMEKGEVYACDLYENRLNLVRENVKRCGFDFVKYLCRDMTVEKAEFLSYFDKVLVDAPCSGLGELNSKPDIMFNKGLDDIFSLQKIQSSLLNTCSKYVKKGGTLVYSTCTLNKIENDGVVNTFLKENKDFELSSFTLDNGEKIESGVLQLTPDVYDGFFIARFVKK